jgi:phasin family protein
MQPLRDLEMAMRSVDFTGKAEDLFKMLAALKVPGVNMGELVASQRYNLEALTASNRAALEGFKAVGEWQVKILQETMQEMSAAMSARAKVTSPQQMVATEAELAKKAFETAVKAMRELAEIVGKANQEATDAIIRRVPKSLDEIKDVLKLPTPPKTS